MAQGGRAGVAGKHASDGWRVAVAKGGDEVLLTAEEARRLAAEMIALADLFEGRWTDEPEN